MKPLKITAEGFGPFAKKQTVDFENLYKDGIFLITGPTGAGKTSVFDAMCFALYGKGSIGDRESSNARSDFASEDTDTYVEFTFKLKDKTIFIKRSPAYTRAKKRGEGFTESSAKAYMEIIGTDERTEGASAVTEKITELLNLTYDQFRQIMMIPQGEFRKFILAGSNEKADIFRRIFDISIFEKFEEISDIKYKNINKNIEKHKEEMNYTVKNIKISQEIFSDILKKPYYSYHEITEILDNGISELRIKEAENHEKKEIINQEINVLSSKLKETENINSIFDEIYNITKEIENLEKLRQETEYKKEKIIKAEKSEKIKPYYDIFKETADKKERKENELYEKKELYKKLAEESEKLEKELKEEEEKYKGISEIKTELSKLTENLEKIKALKEVNKKFEEIRKNKENSEKEIDLLKKESEEKDEKIKSAEFYIEKNHDINTEITKNECEKLKDILKTIKKVKDIYSEYNNAKEIKDKKEKILNEAEKNFEEIKEKNENIFSDFIKSQAYRLARELKDGIPCPVCGSEHHPAPSLSSDKIVTEEDINNSKKRVYETEKKLKDIKEKYKEIELIYHEKISELKTNLELLCEKTETDKKEYKEVLKKIDIIENQKSNELKEKLSELSEKQKIQENLEKTRKELKKLKDEKKYSEDSYKEKIEFYADIRDKYNKILSEKEISEKNIKTGEEETIKLISEKEKYISVQEKRYNEIKEKYSENNNEKIRISGITESAEKEIIQLEREYETKKTLFLNLLNENGFNNYEEFQKNIITKEEKEKLINETEKYYTVLRSKNETLSMRKKSVEGKKYTETDCYKDEIKNKTENLEEVIKVSENLKSLREDTEEKYKKISETGKIIEEKENEYSVIKEIRDVSKGDNESKMSLSKFVLAYYFEEILYFANQRFKKLSDNRYTLLRADRVIDARKNEGLEMLIFDSYTGKEREVKTLSGGESFKAALSMALGLADVVQKYSGGISLDTIFIDEGFGSLDAESLDNAIEVLADLQSAGRTVGIISHVSELKERIKSKIEIIPGKNGSSIFQKN
ncbi:MAG TPA: AAA family ATPase [Tepiditoga sp.]|nr:AAA family ATPase [Tepiditoga sp.]